MITTPQTSMRGDDRCVPAAAIEFICCFHPYPYGVTAPQAYARYRGGSAQTRSPEAELPPTHRLHHRRVHAVRDAQRPPGVAVERPMQRLHRRVVGVQGHRLWQQLHDAPLGLHQEHHVGERQARPLHRLGEAADPRARRQRGRPGVVVEKTRS